MILQYAMHILLVVKVESDICNHLQWFVQKEIRKRSIDLQNEGRIIQEMMQEFTFVGMIG